MLMKSTLRFSLLTFFFLLPGLQVFSQQPLPQQVLQRQPLRKQLQQQKTKGKHDQQTPVLESDFKKVDLLAINTKPREALALINSLYTRSRATHNAPMLIKSVIYRMLFKSYLEEDVYSMLITDLQQDIKEAGQPEKSVLQSLLAETYWKYEQQNSFRIAQRSEIIADPSADIRTWSVKKINDETIQLYFASIAEISLLQHTKVGLLSNVLAGDTATRFLRPTLYDLLAHRALDVFMNTQIGAALVASDRIDFNNPDMMAGYRSFLKLQLPVNDRSDFYVGALNIFQQLLKFHAQNSNLAALADADLKRLKFIYQQRNSRDSETLYFNALEKMAQEARPTVVYADLLYEQAIVLKNSNTSLPDYQAKLVQAVKLARQAIATYPQSIGAEHAQKLIRDIEQPDLQVEMKAFNLPGKALPIVFSYKNVDTAYLKLYKIPIDVADSVIQGYDYLTHSFLKNYLPFKEWTRALPQENNYVKQVYMDKIDALPLGNYMLVTQNKRDSADAKIIAGFTSFKVTGIAVVNRITPQKTQEYYIANSADGSVIKDVHIQEMTLYPLGKAKYERSGEPFKTDKNGYALSANNAVKKALITQGKDSLYTYTQPDYYGRIINDKITQRVVLFTDRPIYRPGQIVFYKGIYFKSDKDKNSAVTGAALEVSFRDVRDKEIQKTEVITNDYGSFQGSFNIPAGKLNGQMWIETKYGNVYLTVEEYKRPSFEISFEEPDHLKDTVKLTGKALTFAGYPVAGAKVKYTVSRYIFSAGYRNPNLRLSNGKITSGTVETLVGGTFKISFLPGCTETDDNYVYQVAVDITNSNGETRSSTKTINLGRNERRLKIDMQERLFLTAAKDTLAIGITNLNGKEVHHRNIEVTWFKLQDPGRMPVPGNQYLKPEKYSLKKEEFIRLFPNEEYLGDSKPENWKATPTGLKEVIVADHGKVNLLINEANTPEGYYKVTFRAIDDDYDTVTVNKIIRIYPVGPINIQAANEWLVVEKNTASATAGAIFRLAGILPHGKAWYEVHYKGAMVQKVWLNTSSKQQIIKINPLPDYTGSFAVQFTMVQGGFVFNKMVVIPINELSADLDIQFLTFRNKLQPGEKESWKLRISNKKGEKQMAEMVATLYDASLDQLQRMDWGSINSSYSFYSNFEWKSDLNNRAGYHTFWFRNKYYQFNPNTVRSYEQLNVMGLNYYGGAQGGYTNYLKKQQSANRMRLLEQTVKKLDELNKGNVLYGIVTDQDGFLLPAVNIYSGKQRIATDDLGIYKINAKPGDELRLIYIGYQPKIVKVGMEKRLDITLYDDMNLLEERVVVSYAATESKVVLHGNAAVSLNKNDLVRSIRNSGEASIVEDAKVYDFVSIETYDPKSGFMIINGKLIKTRPPVVARTDFNETAFFYPQLVTNEAGEINIDFTIPQSVTRYKMMGFAHTKDLKTGFVTRELVTQKQLSISAHAPRFFREGDTILFTANLNNLSGKHLAGEASIEFRDALTGKIIQIVSAGGTAVKKFEIDFNGNAVLKWPLLIPSDINAISYKLIAESGVFSDGEEMTVPVLPNRMLVTESMRVNVRGNTTRVFNMDKLLNAAASKTLRSQSLTFEYTAHPIWNAVQALPYLMEYPDECSEQTFNRFFANSFATGIMNSNPRIKEVFNQWQQNNNGKSLLSDLEKNPQLKSALLQETPWVLQAGSEAERKRCLATLFDLNRMRGELQSDFQKLVKMQGINGSFSWFNGMKEDRYITQYIVLGIGKLMQLKLISNKSYADLYGAANELANKAIQYLDGKLKEDYLKSTGNKKIPEITLNYLYTRSYFDKKNIDPEYNKAFAYYLKKLKEDWKTMDVYQQAQSALILYRNGNKSEALKIVNLLKERAQHSEEMGMYWTDNQSGLWWYQDPIETQALLIAVFDEVATDVKSIGEMKIWLMKNKQANDWKNTKATAAACYALLKGDNNLLEESAAPDIRLGGKTFAEMGLEPPVKEAGTGYQQVIISGAAVKPIMGKVEIKNNNKTMSWGALYWQYFEQLDKITTAKAGLSVEKGLHIKKQLFLEQESGKGAILKPLSAVDILVPGDLVKVRIEIHADRDMEYLHLKDMRSSGFEPVNVISQYKYQDGLGYYESTKDASSNFFIGYMPKGVYVFEYALRVTHAGNFSNGITTLQSMYAPEFVTHSEGIKVQVKAQ